MRFWDSSALVPLLVSEAGSRAVKAQLEADPVVFAWWGSHVECVSAVARREREGAMTAASASAALRRLDAVRDAWAEIQPTERVRATAVRLLRSHTLRSADALQLAAAIAAAEDHPASLAFVTLDDRLGEAAEREGFDVVRPAEQADA